MRKTAVVFAAVVLGVAFARAESSKPTVVGTWEEVSGAGIIEFSPRGTVLIGTREGALSGRYEFVDAGTIRIQLDGAAAAFGPFIVPVRMSEIELALSDEQGNVTHFRRVGHDAAARRVPRQHHSQKGNTQ